MRIIAMIRKLTKQGNSVCLVIERPIRELMGIDTDTPLKVSVEGRRLIVEPLSEEEREIRFQKSLAETNNEYGKALKNLAK
jgi:antitoxin component of MazEF toxin-antitoxin module